MSSTRSKAFRYVFHLLSEGTELFLEGDPERPRFSSIVTPARKFLGDNADAIYHQALIRGDRAYRVTGKRDREVYISFTIHGPDPAGGINGPVLADMNDRQFEVDADGNFELILSADERPGNWVKLDPAARIVLVRSYFLAEPSAQNDPDIRVRLHIEPLDDPGPAPALDDATLAQRMLDTIAFVRATSLGVRVFGEANPTPVPFVSNEPNSVGTPWSFRNTGIAARARSTSSTRRARSTSVPTTRWSWRARCPTARSRTSSCGTHTCRRSTTAHGVRR